MKLRTFLSLLGIILFFSHSSNAQTISYCKEDTSAFKTEVDKRPLDPRDFVCISSKGRNEISPTRWKEFPQQFIDINNKIFIDFDISGLIKEKGFVGNISVEAALNDRKIEVAPYTSVGEEVEQIGVGSVSPTVFARALYQLINEASESVSSFGKAEKKEYSQDFQDLDELTGMVKQAENFLILANKALTDSLGSDKPITEFTPSHSKYWELKLYFERASVFSRYTFPEDAFSISKLKALLKLVGNDLTIVRSEISRISEEEKKIPKMRLISQSTIYYEFDSSVTLLMKYLTMFNETDALTRMAFSKVIGRDPVFIRDFSNVLEENGEIIFGDNTGVLENLQTPQEIAAYDSKLRKARLKVYGVCKDLDNIGVNILRKFGDFNNKEHCLSTDSEGFLNRTYYEKNESQIVEGLREEAAKEMFKKLVRAEINLGKSGAKEGDRLSISILWFNDKQFSDDKWISGKQVNQKTSSQTIKYSAPMVLPLVTIQIKEVGWRKKIIDSFLLIRRSSVPKDENNVSPSNYKGAPGISFVASYSNDEYGISDEKGFFKALEPSFGINVSYLDFDTTKDVEIGIGAVMGLFRNRVFLGGGRNLNVQQSRPYYFIGFSFINIAGELKN